MLNSSGAKIEDAAGNWRHGEMRYTPFGETRLITGSVPTDRRYTRQRQESVGLGSLYDYGARFYAPALGRFLSADTIVPEPNNPQSLNRFSYTYNNPVKYTDPTGHDVDCGLAESGCRREPKRKQPPPPKPPLLPPPLASDPQYGDWFNGTYSGCFMCHAAVANDATVLTNQQLADTYSNAISTGRGPYTVVIVAAGGAIVIIVGSEVIVAAGTAACADGDCTNEIQAADRLLRYVGPDKIQQSGEVMSGAFKDPQMSVFSEKLGVTAQNVLQHFSQGSGVGRVYAFDEMILRNLNGVTDIIRTNGVTGSPFLDARHFEVLNTGTRSMAKLLRDIAVLVLEGNP